MLITPAIDALIDHAIEEDLGSGDLTSEACVPDGLAARAEAIAKSPLVVCGGRVFARVFERIEPATRVELCVSDGELVAPPRVLFRVAGTARALLAAERVALNFLQRMSGIATLARRHVDALPPNSRTRITDTRKTTPGLRVLERYAVRTGGARNHRNDLGSAVMIKDNHIVAAGGILRAVAAARMRAPHTSRIEVEVKSLAELDEALAARADVVLLDNMSDDEVREAARRAAQEAQRPILEASGGITLGRIGELARAGVDVISVGALTHSAPAADISLELYLPADAAGAVADA